MSEPDVPIEESTGAREAFAFRSRMLEMFDSSPLGKDELMFNLGLYVRSSLLVKFLVLADLYKRFQHLPGVLLEFGTWRGQNLVLMENLRAIYEPFNKQRIIIGFDTFTGYPEDAGMADQSTERYGGYNTKSDYPAYLQELLQVHEGANAFGHLRDRHKLVAGDVCETAPKYFEDNPQTLVAFAFFDMGPYKATSAALHAIKPHLMPGSVILFDELTWAGAPGEAIAFKEVFQDTRYAIERCPQYPSKSIVTVL